ncbi:MAG TPA: hypothetical protein VNX68_04675, partial [Nitrosopumilaceae archaeon]|nr:hypothetical protein [Nitrosopumilaceae archaeon]
ANPSHIYSSPGLYTTSLKVTDSTQQNVTTVYHKVSVPTYTACFTNFNSSGYTAASNTLGLSNVIVTWKDAGGLAYSSNNTLQPSDSYFQILSEENFQENENHQPTKKLHVKFRCRVYNGTNSVLIDNADAVIAVAYK